MKEELEFVMVKPDGVARGLIGEVISRIERKGLKIVAMKLIWMTKEQAEQLYAVHKGKPFYEGLIKYVTSGPVVVMVVKGPKAVEVIRSLIGATDPIKAAYGTIRGDYAMDISRNIVHASDSPENSLKERSIFFNEDEFLNYKKTDDEWLFEK
ncbi:MAG: nucleoside-diphosphate kinase [Candidatus Njordarchaeia archaeon]